MAQTRNSTSYELKLKLAQKILPAIKKEVLSSNDIIPTVALPAFNPSEMKEYTKRFGQELIEKYVSYSEKIAQVRAKTKEVIERFPKLPSPLTTTQLAVTLNGVGECGEVANRAINELDQSNCPYPTHAVKVVGKKKARVAVPQRESDYYDHGLFLIGDIPQHWFDTYNQSLSHLRKLPDDCVLLDVSLNKTGKARDTETILGDEFKALGIDRLSADVSPVSIFPDLHGKLIKEVAVNAKMIAAIVKRELELELEVITEKKEEKQELAPGMKKLYEVNKTQNPQLFLHSEFRNELGFFRSILTLSPRALSWDECQKNYNILDDEPLACSLPTRKGHKSPI